MYLDTEKLENLRSSLEQVRKKIIESMDKFTDKDIKKSISLSTANSIRTTISSLHYSTKNMNGFFILPDEIDPEKLTNYFIEKNQYAEDRELLYYFVCYSLKKNINNFYRDIKKDMNYCGLPTRNNKEQYLQIQEKIKNRLEINVKIIKRQNK